MPGRKIQTILKDRPVGFLSVLLSSFRLKRSEYFNCLNISCVLYTNSFNGLRNESLRLVDIMRDSPIDINIKIDTIFF
jgi:hypothetical protein